MVAGFGAGGSQAFVLEVLPGQVSSKKEKCRRKNGAFIQSKPVSNNPQNKTCEAAADAEGTICFYPKSIKKKHKKMCDTFVALPAHTASGKTIFAKNSDREPNEGQAIVHHPAGVPKGRKIRCTYIEIPEVAPVFEVILSKPFQMWGAEMGVNEKGVVIGNEAVFTKIKIARKNDGLTGMDLLRLALERAPDAGSALEIITGFLEKYGQDASGGYQNKNFFYHNSFIIADPREAWVLETAGRFWAAQKVSGFRSISNGLTIGADYDQISPGAIEFARKKGWSRRRKPFDFAAAFSDFLYTRASKCRLRQALTQSLGETRKGRLNLHAALDILSVHNLPDDQFTAAKCSAASICMHPTGLLNPSQTTGSMVVEMSPNSPPEVWLSGTSNPCLSVYKPFFFGTDVLQKSTWNSPGARPDDSLWWHAERLHRRLCRDYLAGKALIAGERERLQSDFLAAVACADRKDRDVLSEISATAVARYRAFLERNLEKSADFARKPVRGGWFYRTFRKKTDRAVRLD